MDKLIGHRGIRNIAPENTMVGFEIAKDHFKWIEIDATLTADEVVVIFHDEYIDDLTTGTGKFGDKTYEQLQQLNVNKRFPEMGICKIPTLVEFLKFATQNNIYVNVEIKDNDERWKLLTDKIINEIEQTGIDTNKLLFSSFNHEALLHLSKTKPNWIIGHLFEHDLNNWQQKCQAVGAKSIHMWNEYAPENIIKTAKEIGLEIYVYTVNSATEYKKLIDLGVDGVFTDELPNRLFLVD